MQQLFFWLWILFVVGSVATILYGIYRDVSRLYWKVVVCLFPMLLSALVVGKAVYRGQSGFKLGVDLVGGTILVYELDPDKELKEGYKPEQLAASLKRRIDPNDLYNVTIRPASSGKRIEIILPTGGAREAEKAEEAWKSVLAEAEAKYQAALEGQNLTAGRGRVERLVAEIVNRSEANEWAKLLKALPDKFPKMKDNKEAKLDEIKIGRVSELASALEKHAGGKREEIDAFIKENYKPLSDAEVLTFVKSLTGSDSQRRDFTTAEIDDIKDKIKKVGSLEFRLLANQVDDRAAMDAVRKFYNEPAKGDEFKTESERLAKLGQLPPLPEPEDKQNKTWPTTRDDLGPCSYSWVEIGRQERLLLGLNNDMEASGGDRWTRMAAARAKNQVELMPDNQTLIFSRKCENQKIPDAEREQKKYEYFLLCRDPQVDPDKSDERLTVSGQDLVSVREDATQRGDLAVAFGFNGRGARRFAELTTKNKPTGDFYRHLAIILDDQIESAPTVREPITGGNGQITGRYTKKDVDQLVGILRSGALPATLKPLPVSENTIGPTLGQDTIDSGLKSVLFAFAAVLVFMCIYYRFAGFVASTALLANLLLTVAFMVFVNATFTLPGLAGLVLMLGMAVDANVLIYERLREERDKGANLLTALRNGYDRALPAIIDTHLTSIFTAIVLYVVGNDQLKGFGISLAAGLFISLFTSLFMTRTIFDLWVKLDLLKNLSMFRFLTKPKIDFMRIRYYWFTATILLTIFGIVVFLVRGEAGLNIDFVGGTAFGGQLKEGKAQTSREMRDLLHEKRQNELLTVKDVRQTDAEGREFEISYGDGKKQKVVLANPADSATAKQVDRKASQIKDKKLEFEENSHELQTTSRESSRAKLEEQRKKLEDERNQLQAEYDKLKTELDPQIRTERQKNVQERAAVLPDWSVEQIFLSDDKSVSDEVKKEERKAGKSRYFTIRTTEKEPDLVHVTINRLLSESGEPLQKQVSLDKFEIKGKRVTMHFSDFASPGFLKVLLTREFGDKDIGISNPAFDPHGEGEEKDGRYKTIAMDLSSPSFANLKEAQLQQVLERTQNEFRDRPQPQRLENFDAQLAAEMQTKAMYAIIASWIAILLYLWLRFGSWRFGAAAVLCLMHDLFFTLGMIAFCHYIVVGIHPLATFLRIEDFKIDLPAIAALLTLIGYSVSDTIVVFDRIREVRGKNPALTPQTINDSVNQTLSRTLLASTTVWLVVLVLYLFGGEGVHLFAFVMVVGVIVGTYSSIYIASPLLLIFGEGTPEKRPGGLSLLSPKLAGV